MVNALFPERIVAAAIQIDGVTHSLPAPARHHDVMYALDEDYWKKCMGTEESGFLTSAGRFVDREEGCRIARAAGQIKLKTGPEHILFSECMW